MHCDACGCRDRSFWPSEAPEVSESSPSGRNGCGGLMPNSVDARRSVLQTAVEVCLSRVPREKVGVDVVHIPTWSRHLELGGQALLDRVYTEGELSFAAGRPERLATRLAAKEAVLQLLRRGIRGVSLRGVEVVSWPAGQPPT